MPIHFENSRWNAVRENHQLWWEGKLKRPLIHLTVTGAAPDRSPSKLKYLPHASGYGLGTPVDEIVDAWDFHLSSQRFLGDAFPRIWLNYGAGVLAAFLGAKLEFAMEEMTTWFHPEKVEEVGDLDFKWNPENKWLKRVKEVASAADNAFKGAVQIGTTDIGGMLDVLSTFRPSENLLLDLYDHPEEVKRQTWALHEMWWKAFEEIAAAMPHNPGHTCWTPIFSSEPYYMTQCDFSYMIGPEMFDEFVLPELSRSQARLGNAFYHLDGAGELPHLDSLLKVKELKGIQWVPGEGQPPLEEWPDVYRRIRDAGKLTQISGTFKTLEKLAKDLGSAEGIIFIGSVNESQIDEAQAFIDRFR